MYKPLIFLIATASISCQQGNDQRHELEALLNDVALTHRIFSDLNEQNNAVQTYYSSAAADTSNDQHITAVIQRRRAALDEFRKSLSESGELLMAAEVLEAGSAKGDLDASQLKHQMDSIQEIHRSLRDAALRYPDMLARMKAEIEGL